MPTPQSGQVTVAGSRVRPRRPTAVGATRLPMLKAAAAPATEVWPCSSLASPTASRVRAGG
jgi:hypothetical protein